MDLEKMTMKELTEFYNSMNQGKKIKGFESKAKAVERIKKLLAETRPGKKQSKMGIIRSMFQDQRSWIRDEIMRRTGFDAKNAHAATNVLPHIKVMAWEWESIPIFLGRRIMSKNGLSHYIANWAGSSI